jgi:hypothetical protein
MGFFGRSQSFVSPLVGDVWTVKDWVVIDWYVLLSVDGGIEIEISISSAYYQDVEFYPIFHREKEGLDTKDLSVTELQSFGCSNP